MNLAVLLRLNSEPAKVRGIDEVVLRLLNARLGDLHPLTLVCATNLASDR
ncbi:hypothetical protein [Streptomyces sp. NBC_00989]|nr:hypothetical protein OG714_54150 [Streptomyces sp. NBC_00989]